MPCWQARPQPPLGAVVLHDLRYAGEEAAAKLARVRAELQKFKADALVVSDPQAVCWLFNIRGSDVPHTPVTLAFALVPKEGRPSLYIDGRKLGNDVRHRLEELAAVRAPENFEGDLAALGQAQSAVRLDPAACPEAIAQIVTDNGGKVLRGSDPIAPMKAVKNAVEIAGARAAQLRDGVAVTRFLAWFDREAPHGSLSEIDAVEALESFRRDTGLLKDVSFPTIAGAGPDGAIVHYRVTRKSNRRITPGELFLVDSGGQYEDGTTDITRTLAVGTPSSEMRRNFTLVLKGHIAIARAVFPDGTTGAQLDTLARQFLWRAGLDFDHGTGHGVGSYLSVHEGPARIAKLGSAPLKRGMILSNEPGYYRTGAYGIRIENLVLVTEAAAVAGAEKPLNAFETLTLGADRRAAGRAAIAYARGNRLARRLSRPRARDAGAAPRRADPRMADDGDDAAGVRMIRIPAGHLSRHSGSPRSGEFGIHIHDFLKDNTSARSASPVIMDSGLAPAVRPGMTVSE